MDQNLELINMLLARLERLSADSYWAHQASGIRGSLLKWVEMGSTGESVNLHHISPDKEREVAELIARGFDVLEKAAKEK
jgi:hypothetical protein